MIEDLKITASRAVYGKKGSITENTILKSIQRCRFTRDGQLIEIEVVFVPATLEGGLDIVSEFAQSNDDLAVADLFTEFLNVAPILAGITKADIKLGDVNTVLKQASFKVISNVM